MEVLINDNGVLKWGKVKAVPNNAVLAIKSLYDVNPTYAEATRERLAKKVQNNADK